MWQFCLAILLFSCSVVQSVSAQVGLPDNNSVIKSNEVNIEQISNPAGSDIFDSYNNQLDKTIAPSAKKNNVVQKPPKTTSPKIPEPAVVNKNNQISNGIVNGGGASKTNLSRPLNRNKAFGSGVSKSVRNKMLNKVASQVMVRAENLHSNAPTKGIENVAKYISAINSIATIKDSGSEKKKMNEIVKDLSSIDASKLSSEMLYMKKNNLELNVLRAANRKVGVKNLAATIDDAHGNGDNISKAISDVSSKLRRGYMNASDKESKKALGAAYNIVSKHSSEGEPVKAIKAALLPFTVSGKSKIHMLSGDHVAKMLARLDHEWEYEDVEDLEEKFEKSLR